MPILSTSKPLNIVVLGGGSWGTTLAIAASRLHYTYLWARNKNQAEIMKTTRENKSYLPGIYLPSNLHISSDLDFVLEQLFNRKNFENSLIVLGVPVSGLSKLCECLFERIPSTYLRSIPIIWTCKGFEEESCFLPSEVVKKVFGTSKLNSGVLSGPSFAKEVAMQLPVAMTIASKNYKIQAITSLAFHGKFIKIYTNRDVVGVELGGALKNVIAIACGISDGLNLGSNARAALITRGLVEMSRLGVALGAKIATFSGLTGLGDLVLTATGELSRNRNAGIDISHGKKISGIISKEITIEGINSTRSAIKRAKELNIELPIMEFVHSILFEGLEPKLAISNLMNKIGASPE